MATIKQLEGKCKELKSQILKLKQELSSTEAEIASIKSGKKRWYEVTIYKTVYADIDVKAIDKDEAEKIAWEKVPDLGADAYSEENADYYILVEE